ncbi:MAG: hypothetical protein JWN93_451 [Hyphomicrobiales bacterium]|nr:hypothetical protein [Hyphomicrobiales bacterium]
MANGPESAADWAFARRALIVIILLALAYGAWQAASLLPLVFASIIFAVLLDRLADLIGRWTRLRRSWSLTVATLALAGALIGFLVMFGAQVTGQIALLGEKLPGAINALGGRIGVPDATQALEETLSAAGGHSVLTRAAGVGYTIFGAVGDMLLILVGAIYLAADPNLYRTGVTKLFPTDQHERVLDAMDVTGNALGLWFGGQMVAMVIVGVVSGLAFWLIGLPSPLALGIVAGVMEFIPFLGPLLGAAPALVFALTQDVTTLLWTVFAVVVIQQLEGYVITPFIQKRAVSLPPALALFSIVAFGLLFGLAGVILAAPGTVAVLVLVKKLWVRQTLGEPTKVPGEDAGAPRGDGKPPR